MTPYGNMDGHHRFRQWLGAEKKKIHAKPLPEMVTLEQTSV